MKLRSFFFHFNRQRAADGLPYTVHVSGQCIPAAQIICQVPTETVWQPEKRSNPRAWVKGRGVVAVGEGHVITITGG